MPSKTLKADVSCESAEGGERLGHILCAGVDVVAGTQFLCQHLFVFSPGDRHRLETHLGRKLHTQMPETADAEDGDHVAWACTTVTKRVEGGDARA